MSKKLKFMWRTSELGDWSASLWRKLKTLKRGNIVDWGVKERHRTVTEMHKAQNFMSRDLKWQKFYQEKFESVYAKKKTNGYTEEESRKEARRLAEIEVTIEFPKNDEEAYSPRAVRKAMNRLNDENYVDSDDNQTDLKAIDKEYERDRVQNEKE